MKNLENLFTLGCDECDKIDGDYFLTTFDDGQQLKWDREKKVFVCPRGHTEDFDTATREQTAEDLRDELKFLLGVN